MKYKKGLRLLSTIKNLILLNRTNSIVKSRLRVGLGNIYYLEFILENK